MVGYKFLIFTGLDHNQNAIERSDTEALSRGCNDSNHWWGAYESLDGSKTCLMIADTSDDKINLTTEELNSLVDIDDRQTDYPIVII